MSSIHAAEEPPKKKSQQSKSDPKVEDLTLAKAMGMTSKMVVGKSAKELQLVRSLYEKEFSKLYIFGKKPMKVFPNNSADLVVDINRLHRAPAESVIYRPLDKKRVLQLID